MTTLPRPLTPAERALCSKLLERDFAGGDALRAQLATISHVIPVNEDESIIEFCVPGYSHPTGVGQRAIPIEGRYLDKDGEYVNVVLFVDANEILYQLERYKFEGEIQEWSPDPNTLTLIGPE